MVVGAQAILFFAYGERKFAVRLQTDESIGDVAAGILQFACPLDILLFVESGLHFDKDRDLFARSAACINASTTGESALVRIECLLDSQHLWVSGCRFNELLCTGAKALIRDGESSRSPWRISCEDLAGPGLAVQSGESLWDDGRPRLVL